VKRGSPVLCCTDRVVDMSTLPLCLAISDKYLAQRSNLVHDGTQLMWYMVVVHHLAAKNTKQRLGDRGPNYADNQEDT
jgi:hypothetical protein